MSETSTQDSMNILFHQDTQEQVQGIFGYSTRTALVIAARNGERYRIVADLGEGVVMVELPDGTTKTMYDPDLAAQVFRFVRAWSRINKLLSDTYYNSAYLLASSIALACESEDLARKIVNMLTEALTGGYRAQSRVTPVGELVLELVPD